MVAYHKRIRASGTESQCFLAIFAFIFLHFGFSKLVLAIEWSGYQEVAQAHQALTGHPIWIGRAEEDWNAQVALLLKKIPESPLMTLVGLEGEPGDSGFYVRFSAGLGRESWGEELRALDEHVSCLRSSERKLTAEEWRSNLLWKILRLQNSPLLSPERLGDVERALGLEVKCGERIGTELSTDWAWVLLIFALGASGSIFLKISSREVLYSVDEDGTARWKRRSVLDQFREKRRVRSIVSGGGVYGRY